MKKLNRLYIALLLNIFLAACNGSGSDSEPGVAPGDVSITEGCDRIFTPDDVYIVDLSQNSTSGVACTMTSDREEIASCVEERIRAAFAEAPACMDAFDVFVPGTNAEDGDYKQFTSIISPLPGRAYLSVQYSDEVSLADAINYDMGVYDASNALDDLLYTLKVRFSNPQVRVFGHSKGSDPVARVSTYPEYSEVEFYAFAQAGRTPASVRGVPGYIHKLSDNLVGITWQNDEVKYFTGGSTGYQVPEIWGFPGYVNQEGGGMTIKPSRIDHHDNYGGEYAKAAHPYCATGNKAAMLTTAECKEQNGVRFVPYFWGDGECTAIAYDMMASAAIGEKHYIGYSGPRAAGCKDTVATVEASYELVYRMNIADQDDCKYNMQLSFNGLDSGVNRADGGKITVSSTRDTKWVRKTGSVRLPYHMKLSFRAYMQDVSGPLSSCVNYLGARSEGYIDKLKVSFTHPGTGLPVTRTLIGNAEGIEYLWPQKVTGKNNVAWRKDSGSWDMHYGIPPTDPTHGGALMVKGETDGGGSGVFYKWLHLVD
jgi:hypothetical protein